LVSRVQFFVDLAYREDFKGKPHKAATNLMSPEKQRYCKQEIAELLERKLMKTTT